MYYLRILYDLQVTTLPCLSSYVTCIDYQPWSHVLKVVMTLFWSLEDMVGYLLMKYAFILPSPDTSVLVEVATDRRGLARQCYLRRNYPLLQAQDSFLGIVGESWRPAMLSFPTHQLE